MIRIRCISRDGLEEIEAEDFPEEFAINTDFPQRSVNIPPEDSYI